MSTKTKVLVIIGCAVSGALNGCAMAWPELIAIFSAANILVATIVATITGVSIAKGE